MKNLRKKYDFCITGMNKSVICFVSCYRPEMPKPKQRKNLDALPKINKYTIWSLAKPFQWQELQVCKVFTVHY